MLDTQTSLQSLSTDADQQSSGPRSIDQIVTDIFKYRRIDRVTQQTLMNTLLGKEQLSSQEEAQVNRVFTALNQGRLRIVD